MFRPPKEKGNSPSDKCRSGFKNSRANFRLFPVLYPNVASSDVIGCKSIYRSHFRRIIESGRLLNERIHRTANKRNGVSKPTHRKREGGGAFR